MFRLTKYIIAALFLVTIAAPACAGAETVTVGMYGVPSIKSVNPHTYQDQLEKAGVNAVFVPDDEETIKWFKEKGYKVFISMNVFGGTGPWKKYTDSRPVKENGELLEEGEGGYGGICPTHEAWRKERLDYIESVLRRFGGKEGIDGIWLDFIRYPGMWEVARPDVPDTCYCKRCLSKYYESRGRGEGTEDRRQKTEVRSQREGGAGTEDAKLRGYEDGRETAQSATNTSSTHPHIHTSTHPPIANYEWMVWKKKQISSFVIEAKRIIERYSKERPVKLGLFLVPWTKGERQNDISFKIAQDAFELSKYADVISPMVYHKMCGQDESWVGRMTEYYKETASCEVWPIVQSHDCGQGEFANVVRYAGEAGADGVLVLSFGGMKPDLWNGLKAFKKPENLLGENSVELRAGSVEGLTSWQAGKPASLQAESIQITQSLNRPSLKTFNEYYLRDEYVRKPLDAVGVKADYGREGEWETALPKCMPGREYLFTGLFYRDTFENGVYADVSIWGQKFRVNEHLWAGTFQPVRVYVTCPDKVTDNTFKFINSNPGTTFYMAKPKLAESRGRGVEGSRGQGKEEEAEEAKKDSAERRAQSAEGKEGEHPNHSLTHPLSIAHSPSPIARNPTNPTNSFFPIGTYGATLNNLEEIKKIGINTVIIGGRGEELRKLIQECQILDLKYILSVPHDPDALHMYLNEIREGRGRGVEGPRVQGGEDRRQKTEDRSQGSEEKGRRCENVRMRECEGGWGDSGERGAWSVERKDSAECPNHPITQSPTTLHGFYVNDEPEIVSFPINKANDIQRLIKDRFPEAATYMAVVRPQKVRDYASASDYFMMDQYPVPSMPMVWLSDSMDEAAAIVGRERIVSVIQAFGGGEEAKHGWTRLPTRQEMECLTFLSIVHGGRGVFYFTFSEISKTEEGRKNLAHVVGQLNKLGEWLSVKNIEDRGRGVEGPRGRKQGPRGQGFEGSREGAGAAHGTEGDAEDGKLRSYEDVKTGDNPQPSAFSLQSASVTHHQLPITMLSPYGMDQKGRPAIYVAIKKKGSQRLVIAVNTIATGVEALIHTNTEKSEAAREIFSESIYGIIGGAIQARFKPYEVKVFLMNE